MTINEAIMQLVMMAENSMMPNIFRPALDKVIETISELEQEPRWIPCSERLPEEDNVEVLCTVKQQSITDHSETIIVEQGCYFYGTWLLSYDNQRVNCTREVIAWQPLPSPYREEADE